MDVKKWLEDNSKGRRNNIALLLGMVVFPSLLLIGLYQLYRNIDSLETTSRHNVEILSTQEMKVLGAHNAQVAFSRQMDKWNDALLLSHNENEKQQNWNEYLNEEELTRKAIEKMYADAVRAHEVTRVEKLGQVLEMHKQMSKEFRSIINNIKPIFSSATAFQAEQQMGKSENYFSAQLEQISDEVIQEYKRLTARIEATQVVDIEDLQGRVELNLIVITLMILVEALLLLRTVHKSTQELNQLAEESERTVYHLAYSDPLTDLPNRRLFQDRLEHAIAQSNRTSQFRALMYLDMDNFKTLNDTKGHGMGDLLLIEVAKRLKACVRLSDTVARLGGDEFVALLGELNEDEQSASEQTLMIAEKISKALSQPYYLNNFVYNCSASIGVAMIHDPGLTIEEAHKRADAAMYQAKNAGRNTIRFYDPHTQAALEARSELEHSLRNAISNQQLHVYFQVQVDQKSRPIGAEALIRWMHPTVGMIFPGQFIPMAEETGLILSIGQWMLESVCKQIKLWETDPLACNLQIAVNVSARQFHQADFVMQINELIKKSGINPSRLKLELTESMVLNDVKDTVVKMNALKQLGLHFSMDDFGTGYSSLSYLTQLPLDQLKVDQSFVRNIGIKPSDSVIIQTIIGMAASLKMESIAEGVETEAQHQFLEKAGCKYYQGYLFGKPVPLEKFTDALKEI